MVQPDIKTSEDLKGKKIGVSSLGSLTDFLGASIAKKKGLNPDRDITLITTGAAIPSASWRSRRVQSMRCAVSHPGYGRGAQDGL